MDSKEREELFEIWSKFLNTDSREESEIWLDAFLAKFLNLASNNTKDSSSLICCWRSASNSLAHQLLVDVHQICSQMTSSSCETTDEGGEDEDSYASAALQKYLLDGRGWKLLWCLEILGIENLSCAKDLVDLLITLIPVALTSPVRPSTVPVYILSKLSLSNCDSFLVSTRDSIFHRRKRANFSSVPFHKVKNRHRSNVAGKIALRKRVAKKKGSNVASSSENEVHIHLIPPMVPEIQQMSYKVKLLDAVSLQTGHPSETDETDIDVIPLSLLLCDEVVSDFNQYSLCAADFINFVLYFLEKITIIDQKCITLRSLCCPIILEFSLNCLKNIKDGKYTFDGWSELQIKNLRNRCLQLMFLSATESRNMPGEIEETAINDILNTVLSMSSNVITSDSVQKLNQEDAHFVCDVASGILSFIINVVRTCNTDFTKIICVIRMFLSYEGVNLFCRVVSYFERADSSECYVSSIFSNVKNIILSLKALRAQYSYHESSKNLWRLPENLNDLSHHHNDALGSTFSHSVTQTVPMCCIAAMCHLMLKMYSVLTVKPTAKLALKAARDSGICCCVDPDFVVKILLQNFENFDSDMQQSIVSILEKVLYPQLGITLDSSSWCCFCEERKAENQNSPNLASNFPVQHLQAALEEFTDISHQKGLGNFLKWTSLNAYIDLLNLSSLPSIILVTKHITYLLLHGVDFIKNELFIRVVIPDLLKVTFLLRNKKYLASVEQIRIDCFLSLLPSLLNGSAEYETFIQFGGIRILYELLFFDSFRVAALNALKVLILQEVKNHVNDNSDVSSLYFSEPIMNSSSMITFSDILCQYSKSFSQNISRYTHVILNGKLKSQLLSSLENSVFIDGTKSGRMEHEATPGDFHVKRSILFLYDLWSVCKEIILTVPESSSYLYSHVMWDSYSLFISLMRNLKLFSEVGNEEFFEKVLLLIRHLLTIFLHFQACIANTVEQLPSKQEILKTVRTLVQDCKLSSSRDLQLLLHSLLKCSLFSSDNTGERQPLTSRKARIPYGDLPTTWDNSPTSSERSDSDKQSLNSSYDGDSEKSDSDDPVPSSSRLQLRHRKIQHGEVVITVLELLKHFIKVMDQNQWIPMALQLMQLLVRLCRDCESNIAVLNKQGICSNLLEGFFEVLSQTDANIEELQKAVMELFKLVSQHSLSSINLKIIIRLMKSPIAPFGILVNALKSIAESAVSWPSKAVAFPCCHTRLRYGKDEGRKKLKLLLQLYDMHYRRKGVVPSTNAWSCMAAAFPLSYDISLFTIRQNFSLSLWIMFEEPNKETHGFSNNNLDGSNEQSVYHVLSLGSERVLLEMWVDVLLGDLIFRINFYDKKDVYRLGKETCKGFLKPGLWHYLTVTYKEISEVNNLGKKMVDNQVHVLIDGEKESTLNMKYDNLPQNNNSDCFILFGHSLHQNEFKHHSFYIGNFMLFKGEVMTKEIAFYLHSLGPDVTNISHCVLQNRRTFFPPKTTINMLNQGIEQSIFSGLCVPSLEPLQRNLLLSYSAEKPTQLALYPRSPGIIYPLLAPFQVSGNLSMISQNGWPSQQEPTFYKLVTAGHLVPHLNQNIFAAVHNVGGITVFLFLFARVIECCPEGETQASALQLLLHLVTNDCENADYFLKIGGDQILQQLLTNNKCIFSNHMLKVFTDCCFSANVMEFSPLTNNWHLDHKSEAFVYRPSVWILLVKSILNSKNCHNSVQLSFINIFKMLLRSDHPHLSFISQQMKSVHMLETFLAILKYRYIIMDNCLPVDVAIGIPYVIQKLLCLPINFQQIRSICNFLLLMHQASDTYVCHAKSSFYFLLASSGTYLRTQKKRKKKVASLSETGSVSTLSSNESVKEFSVTKRNHKRHNMLRSSHSMNELIFENSAYPQIRRASSLVDIASCNERIDCQSLPTKDSIAILKSREFEYPKNADVNVSFETESTQIVKCTSLNFSQGRGDAIEKAVELIVESSPQTSRDQLFLENAFFFHKNKTSDGNSESALELITAMPSEDKVEICMGLMKILIDVMNHTEKVGKQLVLDVILPEVFVVLAYNLNSRICCAALEVIYTYLQRAPEEKISAFLQMKCFHLIANQLHQLPTEPSVIGVCFNMMFFGKHVAEDLSGLSLTAANSFQVMSWVPLLSILPNTYKEIGACNSILSALCHLVTEVSDVISSLAENGLCESLLCLLTQSVHYFDSDCDSTLSAEQSTVINSIFHILRVVSSNLFSSKRTEDFAAFSSMLQILFMLENDHQKKCSSSAFCVTSLRDCQCVIFQAALDFVEVYNYRKLRDDDNVESGNSSLWEILISMPDSLNPYSSFLSSPTSSVSSESKNSDFSSASYNTIRNAQKANKELPISVAVDRFRYILSSATNFVLFRDANCIVTTKQKNFFRSLFHSVIRGLSTMMESGGYLTKTKWSAVIWSAKDSLRLQLGRLVLAVLALEEDIEQKLFVLEILAHQRRCADILMPVILSATKVENIPVFLYSLYSFRDQFSEEQKHDFLVFFSFLQQNLQGMDFSSLENKEYIKQCTEEWKQLWLQDRQKWISKMLTTERKLSKKLEGLAKQVSEIAMDVTKRVVDMQSLERINFMEEVKVKNGEEITACETWHVLVEQMTHERAVWYIEESCYRSWELDPTEGPHRIRKRLRRCYLNVEKEFVMEDFRKNLETKNVPTPFISLLDHENGVSDSSLTISKVHTNEKIEYACPCKVVMPLEEINGELLIGDHFLHFIGEQQHKKQKIISERWSFRYIKEILPRRFELRNNALEIFMENGLTFLVAFPLSGNLEEVWLRFQNHKLPCVSEIDANPLTRLWLDGSITNFEYLTQLNKLAGRSFNDLMQYPVFPFVLADYSSLHIDLNDAASYRNLAKPVSVQHKEREEYYIKSYNALKEDIFRGPWCSYDHPISGPFHYGSHYSNSGTVLHFLVRLLPYTYGLIQYQDSSFDIPDRTFHSVDTSWQLVTKTSFSDVKELIPEFFFLPEFLCNNEGFDLGIRQNGERVNNVQLPPWCNKSPRLFVLIHRQALESYQVSENLNAWIDLVFGYKQTGVAAVNAINVFHPATYFGMDISKIKDPVSREALKATIKTVGQMPRQLFDSSHSVLPLSIVEQKTEEYVTMKVLPNVDGIKWGDYVGSPSTGTPNLVWRFKQSTSVGKLLAVFTNDVFGLQKSVCVLLNHTKDKSSSISSAAYIRSSALISWYHSDGVVRIKFSRDHPPVPLLKKGNIDPVCLCASDPDCNELFVAQRSGAVFVYNFNVDCSKFRVTENKPPIQLNGHSGAVKSIHICKAFSIVVTGSEDNTCIIWDLNKLCYVRSIESHTSTVKLVCVSDTLGDVVSVSDSEDGSCIHVHTINGELVGRIQTSSEITAVCYSSAPEGISVNVIATGLSTGSIRLWSSWDLTLVREIQSEKFLKPITCMTFSVNNQYLYAANTDGTIAIWEKPSQLLMNMPRVVMFT